MLHTYWEIIVAVFVAGGAWTVIFMKSQALETRLDHLRDKVRTNSSSTAARIGNLSNDLAAHKTETAARLGRIEAKIDILLNKAGL